jgi:predicted O-methyltransferase YrrM
MTDLETFAKEFAKRFTMHVDTLNAIVKETGESLEGNCMYVHQSEFQTSQAFLNKQLNIVRLAKESKGCILEIGFNAGHSALLWLMTAPEGTVFRFFDIATHAYVRPCFAYLQAMFPDQDMELIVGDSRETLPTWIHEHPEDAYDLIHVDGGHDYECVKADVHSALLLSRKGTILLMDDMDNVHVRGFVETLLQDKVAEPILDLLETPVYPHMALRLLSDCRLPSTETQKD